ncbi:MAG: LruC domain-containing protein [bacterium]
MKQEQPGNPILWGMRTRLLTFICLTCALRGFGVGDASTSFQIFVPPNNDPVGRDSALIVTNVSPIAATVTINDTNADADKDDSISSTVLTTGQSQVVFIKDNSVNDDAQGKWDGDYFTITSDQPVVTQIATKSDWQWDFVPADNKTMRGQSFFIYSPATSFSDRDVNVYSYEPDTDVSVLKISTEATQNSGKTSVNLTTPTEILKTRLQTGEDLIVTKKLGIDVLDAGHTFWVRSSKPVTVMSGSLVGNSRDGMAFVPSSNGSSSGELFYFMIPADYSKERELRLIAWENGTAVALEGWNEAGRVWQPVQIFNLDRGKRGDWIESTTSYRLYKLSTNPGHPVSVLIADWMEAGDLSGTKDDTSFASAQSGYGAGKSFMMYLPPPGTQNRVLGFQSTQTHVFIYGSVNNTRWTVRDTDTSGGVLLKTGTVNKGEYARVSVDGATYNAMNKPADGRRPYVNIEADKLITCQISNFNDNWMTFVPSVTLPNPHLETTTTQKLVPIGSPVNFSLTANNVGFSPLLKTQIKIIFDAAAQFNSALFTGISPGSPTITTDPVTNQQIVTWDNLTIAQDIVIGAGISYQVKARRPDNSLVRNNDFLSHAVQIRGEGYGTPAAQGGESELFTVQSSVAMNVLDTHQTVVNYFTAQTSGSAIAVRWQTQTEPDVNTFKVWRATSGDGPFTLLPGGAIAAKGDSQTGANYQLNDTNVNGNTIYYYRLDLIDKEGGTRSIGPVAASYIDTIPPDTPAISSITGSDSRVDLIFVGGNRDGDLKGYELFRASNVAGPYSQLNGLILVPGFTDNTALNGMTFFYKVRAVDTTGNRSGYSDPATVTLNSVIASTHIVAYEDQLGPSPNDWDYNDFVIITSSTETFSNGGLQSLRLRIEAAARGATIINQFWQRVKLNGAWSASVSIYADRNAPAPISTQPYSGTGDARLQIWNRTLDALPPPSWIPGEQRTNTTVNQTTPTLGQVAVIQINLSNPSLNPSNSRHTAPFDPYLKGNLGEIHIVREGYPNSTEVVAFWPNSPLTGFNTDYVLVIEGSNWVWPRESRQIWDAYPDRKIRQVLQAVFDGFAGYLLSGKTSFTDWWLPQYRVASETWNHYVYPQRLIAQLSTPLSQQMAQSPSPSMELMDVTPSPIVASLNELAIITDTYTLPTGILVGTNREVRSAGIPTTMSLLVDASRARPVVCALTSGGAEMLLTADENYDGNAGIEAHTWPDGALQWRAATGMPVKSALVTAQLDPSGDKSVICVSDDAQLFIIKMDGSLTSTVVPLGIPQLESKNTLISPTPLVADVNGDGVPEIIAASAAPYVHVVNTSGADIIGWPVSFGSSVTASPIVLKQNGSGEARILIADRDGVIDGRNARGLRETTSSFPINYGEPIIASPALLVDQGTGTEWSIWAGYGGKVSMIDSNGVMRSGWPVMTGDPFFASPVTADVDGDSEYEVIAVSETGNVFAWKLDGTAVDGFPLSVAAAVQSTPVAVNLVQDGRAELWIGTALGQLYRWKSSATSALSPLDIAGWYGYAGSITATAFQSKTYTKLQPLSAVDDRSMY